ncbi:hypothetical protein WS71_32145 [Burkholderia mayonis]|uniref:Uncharacterized protein n=1 Tax=Burkholderia mayonis TaxID=1385591 RepID=A0A1B4G708_9BURK|nr:hypothetical protein WS71_32145 [Burkholderia mayonis]KVE54595.1 hypothetical protein WS71_04000 [Burkholderia mayonis]
MCAPAVGAGESIVGVVCRAALRVEAAAQTGFFAVLHRARRGFHDKPNCLWGRVEVADHAQA